MRDDRHADADTARPDATGPSRRNIVAGGALAAAGLLVLGAPQAAAAPPAGRSATARRPLSPFTAVAASESDTVTVPTGCTATVLAPWGRPIRASGPRWRTDAGDTAAEQAQQVGSHHHGVQFFPLADGAAGNRHGLLVIGHEATDPDLLGGGADKAIAAQGLTVLEVRRSAETWKAVDSARNRRVTGDTPVRFSGPVAVDGRPRGVLACSGHGITPWGTYLAAEENVNAAFGTDDPHWRRDEQHVRYGLSANGFGHPWHHFDARFDLAAPEARPEEFGWIVELDPHDPSALPVKRTALGRFAHGSATVTETAGRLVLHSTDAEDGGHLYKFVSSDNWRRLRDLGRSPLDHGTLYAARISPDGTGRWLPLTHGHGPLTRANGWHDQADVLVRARTAADALGATPLARPERVAVSPLDGRVYLALANSTGSSPCAGEAANGTTHTPCARSADPYGRVIRWRESEATPDRDGDGATPLSFHWEEFLTPGDPTLRADGAFAAPKGLWFGADGTLWISTGVSGHALNGPDDIHRTAGNNALLAADPTTKEVRRFLTAPRGAEVTGVTSTPDGQTLFVNIQHPGERTARWGAPGPDNPRAVSNWPDHSRNGRPRSATVAVHRTT
ncbi:PhoX family protein [Streptomyces pristinaespiralis]|uniref:PhoX family protein n=1 Tax=Streptomyces pristinaespiralis TaxID=38300 RepID=UPI0038353598